MTDNAIYVQDDINENLVGYDAEKGTMVFKDAKVLERAGIKAGDVIFSNPVEGVAPDGYLVKVTSVREENGEIILETEPAGLDEAFESFDLPFYADMSKLTKDCFTFYDIVAQADNYEAIYGDGETKAEDDDKLFELKWDSEDNPCKITFDSEKTTVEYVFFDLDEDYKTKNDQLKLRVSLGYNDILKCAKHSYDSSEDIYKIDISPRIDIDAAIICEFDHKYQSKAKKEKYMNVMEKKLIGKKFKLGSIDIPAGGLSKIVVNSCIEIYAAFNLTPKGKLQLSYSFKDIGFDIHAEVPNIDNNKSYIKGSDEFHTESNFSAEAEIKGSAGVGVGLVCGLTQFSSFAFDKRVKPYVGGFLEFNIHGDLV